MKTEEELIWESYILKESPWDISTGFEDDYSHLENLNIDEIKNQTDYLENFQNIKIYYNDINREKEYYFIDNNKLAAYYRYFIINPNKIETKMIWNSKQYQGVFRNIFINYLLPKYKNILSDNIMSKNGFNFWMKLKNETRYNIFLIHPDGHNKPILSSSVIDKYKEKLNTEFKYTRFLISYE